MYIGIQCDGEKESSREQGAGSRAQE